MVVLAVALVVLARVNLDVEQVARDAMTDGMYGDYPGGDVDYEVLGF